MTAQARTGASWLLFLKQVAVVPFTIALWPVLFAFRWVHQNFLTYLFGHVRRDRKRIYRIRFIWYGDSIYLHPMIWGSLLLAWLTTLGAVSTGWALLIWFVALFVCYITILYNIDVVQAAVLGVGVIAFFGMAHFATVEFSWNPLTAVATHIESLHASVSPGFFIGASYVFLALILSEMVRAWLFHRVEIDQSYVYEHQFLKVTTREPIFARGLKRETRDILELLLLGAGDIQHRTRSGYKAFRNVPFASLWLGTAIDSLLDFQQREELQIDERHTSDGDPVRPSDARTAVAEAMDEADGGEAEDADDGEDQAG